MKYDDKTVESLPELIAHLKADVPNDRPTWFRGLRCAEWNLEPSIARNGGWEAERALWKRFKQNAFSHVASTPTTEWEWLFLMQHYDLPTRLLDWTESALIGLYFAIRDEHPDDPEKPAALWAMDPIGLNEASKWNAAHKADIPGFDDDEDLDGYLPSRIRRDGRGLDPIAAIAARTNPRIQVQQGVFTIHHRQLDPLNDGARLDHLWRYTIPATCIAELRTDLAMLNITKLSLFPELVNVANHARATILGE